MGASSTTSLATLRPDLAGCVEHFNLEADQAGFIAQRVLPVLEVASRSGNFGKILPAQLLQNRDTKRAPNAGYNRSTWQFDDAAYATKEYGAEEAVDDNNAAAYRDYFDAEVIASRRAYDAVLRGMEQRVSDAVFNTTTFGAATDVTNEWDDYDAATPLDDVESIVQAVWAASGMWPNAIIMNKKVFRNLRMCYQMVERISANGAGDKIKAADITAQMIGQAFDLEHVLVGGGTKNTAIEGQSPVFAPIWSNEYVMVGRIATGPDPREACIGRMFHWGEDGSEIGGHVESYRDETVRGNVVRVRHQVDEKILVSGCGALLGNITT